jgi:PPOX class probable F420-dependent enzyme
LLIDANSEFGERVHQRLDQERIAWFTTVASDGTPQPRPVWFLWTGESFLIFSRPEGFKVQHLEGNPRTALHLDGDGRGGDIIVFVGDAQVVQAPIPSEELEAYITKYREGFKRINMTPESFTQSYQTAIRMTPTKLRGH